METATTTAKRRVALLTAPPPPDALALAVESFSARCRARGLAPRTLEYHALRLDKFTAWLAEQHPAAGPREVTPAMLRDFLAHQMQATSKAGAKSARIVLGAFFAHLVRPGRVRRRPHERACCACATRKTDASEKFRSGRPVASRSCSIWRGAVNSRTRRPSW